jgi:uncharacterized protein YcbK (DUF882 family)
MSVRRLAIVAISGVLGAGCVALALLPRAAPAAIKARVATPIAPKLQLVAESAATAAPVKTPFSELPALRVLNQTTRESRSVKLYDASGHVDEAAAAELDALLCDARDPKQHHATRLERRTLQLLFKAAYHFASAEIEVVSAYRKPGRRREGPHGNGTAIDFRLPGVKAQLLASYLRQTPRTGVGVYTHPKTQYVHVDVREQSFHWLDASPPRRRYRERSIGARDLVAKDRSYTPALDLPEGLAAYVKAASAR